MSNYYNDFEKNKLIERLPPVRDKHEYIAAFERTPYINELERQKSVTERAMCVSRLSEFRVAREFGYTVDFQIAEALRKGYRLSIRKDIAACDELGGSAYKKKEGDTTAFVLIGPSGVGKTTVLNASLDYYDQVITHNGPDYVIKQITYIKVECPPTCSIKSFYDSCIYEMEKALDYEFPDKKSCKTADQKERLFKNSAIRWNLGVLIIDEIQNLLASKNNNLLNQFLTLTNELSVPIIFVGTDMIIDYFRKSEFFTKRRLGIEIKAQAYEKDVLWDFHMQNMWQYQWMQEYIPLTEEMKDLFYRETGGIINRMIELFANAQKEAIFSGKDTCDRFTPEFVKHVSQSRYSLSRDSLNAIGNPAAPLFTIKEADLKQTILQSNQDGTYWDMLNEEAEQNKTLLIEEQQQKEKSQIDAVKNNVLTNVFAVASFLPFAIDKEDIDNAVNKVFADENSIYQAEEILTKSIMKLLISDKSDGRKARKKSAPSVSFSELPMFEGVV